MEQQPIQKMRILCLHGKFQNGPIFANKIGGAKRKLSRFYELHFLNGPICLDEEENDYNDNDPRAWWLREESTGKHVLIQEAFEYVQQETYGKKYDAILGFSQGGTLATGLAVGGVVKGVRAVITAGSPFVGEVLDVAQNFAAATKDDETPPDNDDDNKKEEKDETSTRITLHQMGLGIPKLHMAGETDKLISVESTKQLCDEGGNGMFVTHEKGHLFPTRAALVNQMIDFLSDSLQ